MFALFFPPAATGWQTFENMGQIPDEPAARLDGGWPHTEARVCSRTTRAAQRNRWIIWDRGGMVDAGANIADAHRQLIPCYLAGSAKLVQVRVLPVPLGLVSAEAERRPWNSAESHNAARGVAAAGENPARAAYR